MTDQTKEPLATIERLIEKLAAGKAQAATAAYRQLLPGAGPARCRASTRRHARRSTPRSPIPSSHPAREKFRGIQTLLVAAANVQARVMLGARKLRPGDSIRVGGLEGEFIRIEDEKLYWKVGEATGARPLADLKPGEALAIATVGAAAPNPQLESKVALFLLACRDYEAGRKHLAAAKAGGIDIAEESALFDRLVPRPCPTCHGKQTVPCPACEGKGTTGTERVECEACKGTGVCPKCHGICRFRCTNCFNGIVRGMPCPDCNGTGSVTCSACRGTGSCKACGGEGRVSRRILCEQCKGKAVIPCATCGGKGQLPPLDLAAAPDPPKPTPPEKAAGPPPLKAP